MSWEVPWASHQACAPLALGLGSWRPGWCLSYQAWPWCPRSLGWPYASWSASLSFPFWSVDRSLRRVGCLAAEEFSSKKLAEKVLSFTWSISWIQWVIWNRNLRAEKNFLIVKLLSRLNTLWKRKMLLKICLDRVLLFDWKKIWKVEKKFWISYRGVEEPPWLGWRWCWRRCPSSPSARPSQLVAEVSS